MKRLVAESQRVSIIQPGVARCNRATPGYRGEIISTLKGLNGFAPDRDSTLSGLKHLRIGFPA